jgi:hypothetical protein
MVRRAHHEVNLLKALGLILSLSKPHPEEARSAVSKDEAKNFRFFSSLLDRGAMLMTFSTLDTPSIMYSSRCAYNTNPERGVLSEPIH